MRFIPAKAKLPVRQETTEERRVYASKQFPAAFSHSGTEQWADEEHAAEEIVPLRRKRQSTCPFMKSPLPDLDYSTHGFRVRPIPLANTQRQDPA